jgi:hypothetical protein
MSKITENINDLLSLQGLDLTKHVFNHNSLSNFLIECRDEIEKLETGLEHTMECFIGARAALKDCIIERDEARKVEGTPEKSVYKEGYRAVEEAMGHPSPEFWVERKYDRRD